MQTNLSEATKRLPRGDEAERILRSCVHCGFCTATCPTYQLLGDELDGPRGRIYLIKQVLEGEPVTASTQLHLDRCLSCRNCETTCPSGVKYHDLLDIGRPVVEQQVPRPLGERLLRLGLRAVVPHPSLFKALTRTGQALRPLLPGVLKAKLPARIAAPGQRPAPRHARRVLLLEGCVQPALSPNTNAAAARLLDRLGISVQPVAAAGCCGAVDYHLNAQEQGLARARRNIDAWWPAIEAGAEAIVQTASGCGAFVRDYGHLLANDPRYAAKAARISALARDLVEVVLAEPLDQLGLCAEQRLAFHCPCTLQHALKLGGAVEQLLTRLGFTLTPVPDGHLCCGSAGTYSLTQPTLSRQLRDQRLTALESGNPQLIATANIGCQTHLDSAGRTPVRHWVEIVDAALPSTSRRPTSSRWVCR
ncbi:glycolate oxidase subunit GlcF [Pseudomonas guariconensis]|uniref:glycolate oxidase subunit GlcF n=1 Tax=Pseudomonas guariconensis TaxID=1288410 RepID=UPI002B0619B2|nr:glycolate oxidase subunit GlcF [Pseudomonas guariconensis]